MYSPEGEEEEEEEEEEKEEEEEEDQCATTPKKLMFCLFCFLMKDRNLVKCPQRM